MNPRHTRENLTHETHESMPPTHTRYPNYLADSPETYYALRKILYLIRKIFSLVYDKFIESYCRKIPIYDTKLEKS